MIASWQQIGIDICSLKATPDGFRYIVLVVDYFTNWVEAKALKDKTAVSVAQFLYECICRHNVPAIQINYQGREFVNSVSSELRRLTGTEERNKRLPSASQWSRRDKQQDHPELSAEGIEPETGRLS